MLYIDMKYLCVDFGTKKCGLAQSDDFGSVAMPLAIVATRELDFEISKLFAKNVYAKIVFGESRDSMGNENAVFAKAKEVAEKIYKKYKIEIVFEKEFFSSKHARADDGKRDVDDRAAALILQRYLDKENIKNKSNEQRQEQADFEDNM